MESRGNDHPEVLIIGAGPSGLVAALQLAAYGINFRIVDRKETLSENSRAVGIQARSLELFEQMGLVEDILARGRKAEGLDFHTRSRTLRIDLFSEGQVETGYPFILLLEQRETERIFYRYLQATGHEVDWGTEADHLQLRSDGVTVQLLSKGVDQTISARWLIAADGANSFVRAAAGVVFTGGTYEQRFAVVDVKEVEGRLDQQHLTLNLNPTGAILLLPLPASKLFRLVTNYPPGFENKEPEFEDIRRHIATAFPGGLKIGEPQWYSNFRIQSRSVASFRHGSVLFVGDAAHVHSPIGAQGMNTGIQDACNLAWKLAMVIEGALPERVLDTYHQERHPIARRLLATTDRLFQMVARRNLILRVLRVSVYPYLVKLMSTIPRVRRWAFRIISQIGISYGEGMIVRDDGRGFAGSAPCPGERMPYVHFTRDGMKTSAYSLFAYGKHHLLIFARDDLELAAETAAAVEDKFSGYLNAYLVTHETVQDHLKLKVKHLSCDGVTFSKFAGGGQAGFLVRPDTYIAARSAAVTHDKLLALVESYFFARPYPEVGSASIPQR